jgi:hypothetical protein
VGRIRGRIDEEVRIRVKEEGRVVIVYWGGGMRGIKEEWLLRRERGEG